MEPIDLAQLPLVDNHCHGVYRAQGPFDAASYRALFTESFGDETRHGHAAETLYYRRLLRALAERFGCALGEAAVLAARNALDGRELIRTLLGAANVEMLLLDLGYPPAERVLPYAELGALAGCHAAPMLRLETLMQELIAAHARLDDVIEALRTALADIRAAGYVALKSIAAYRTGLAIRVWPRAAAAKAFRQARDEVAARGTLRLAQQPLLDTLLHVAFAAAARQEVPVQFHTGYGDTDADLLMANPLHLRGVLEQRAYRGMPVVVLHGAYPYTPEGAYLAAGYDNDYPDLSYYIPILFPNAMRSFTRPVPWLPPS